MKISGARAVVECLLEQGVDTVFGYPGGMILPLYDAIYDMPSLRHILTVHEQGAAHAADGYARATGRVGVCIATSGPGATNLITGLAAAHADSVPVVAITGQVPISLIGTDAFQEVDITGMTMAITKHNFQVKDINKLPEIMRQAFRIATSGRQGPVLVDIPRDIQIAEFEFERTPALPVKERPISAKVRSIISEAAEAIRMAKKPVIIVGGGAVSSGAHQEIRQLAEKCRLPVVSTLMGLGGFPASHPQALGLTGLHGHKAANNTVHNADVIIAAGSRFSDRVTGNSTQYASDKLIIHIDIDPAEIDKNVLTHLSLEGDAKKMLALLNEIVEPGEVGSWWDAILAWQLENAENYTTDQFTVPWMMRHISDETVGKQVIFATDVGQHQMWAAQHLKLESSRTWITSGGLGAMGFGLPAAMGAQFGMPEKRTILIVGDGGIKMTGNELYTIATHCLPVVTIIINNTKLGMIRQLQHAFYDKRYMSCCLPEGMDFTLYAKCFGIDGVAVNNQPEFAQAFARALASAKPHVIVVNVGAEDFVTPMVYPGGALDHYVGI